MRGLVLRFQDEEIEAVKKVILSGELSSFYRNPEGGKMVREFEERIAEYFRVEHAVVFNSGTSALFASLTALGIGKGARVAVPALTFVATATSALMCGAEVVFVDVDETFNMNPSDLELKCEQYGVDVIMPVHLLGNPCDMRRIREIAMSEGIPVVEDACQAIGAKFSGRYVGTIGDVGVFSFQETKTITTLGEGGAVLTNEEWIARRLRMIRNHGEKYFQSSILGYNFRMTEAQAAFGSVQLGRLKEFNDMQVKNARTLLRKLPKLFISQKRIPEGQHVYSIVGTYIQEKEYKSKRDVLVDMMVERGVSKGRPGSTVSLGYTAPLYSEVSLLRDSLGSPCLNADKLCNSMVWFDVHRWKSEVEFESILEVLLNTVGEWMSIV